MSHLFFDNINYVFEQALIVGKFAPITTGHINFIRKSAQKAKQLKVVLCFDEKWLSKQDTKHQSVLTLENRLSWLKEVFKDDDNITIDFINETNLQPYPHGWADYANLLRESYGGEIPLNTAIFSSELEYDNGYKTHLPELVHVVVDSERKDVPISATMVRNDFDKYINFVPDCVRHSYFI